MNLATLRVEGTDASLNTLKDLLALSSDAQWKKGEQRENGGAFSSSGFNATIAEAKDPRELVSLIHGFLEKCQQCKIDFSALNLEIELDVGLTVGDSSQYVASIELSPADLWLCAQCGINLCVTAYPTSDEETDGE